MDIPAGPTNPTVRLSLADGTTEEGTLLSAAVPELTVALPPGNALELVKGTRIAIETASPVEGAPEMDAQGATPALVASVEDLGDLGLFVTLDLVDRSKLAQMQIGTLKHLLNQREVFRTPIQAGTVGRTFAQGLDRAGAVRTAQDLEAFLVDASFEGVGLLVTGTAEEALASCPLIRITVEGRRRGRTLLEVTGTVRHRSPALRGVRLGVAAGGKGVRWTQEQEVALREFVLEQQRRALERRRRAG